MTSVKGVTIFTSATFFLQVDSARIFKRGGSLVDDVAPSAAFGRQSRSLTMINVAGTERFFQGIFITSFWSLSFTVARGELAIQNHLG